MTRKLLFLLSSSLLSLPAFAQDPAPAAPPAAAAEGAAPAADAGAAAASAENKKKGGGPSLSLSPQAPQVGGMVVSPADATPVLPPEETSSEWKFDVSGYFRAPLRMSWGPPTTQDPLGGNAGTQYRTPALVPDGNYVDWRYTNSMVGPWTELNFHYGNSRAKATVQIASYNLTDSGYRRLEAQLGINQAFLTLNFPELINDDTRLILNVGGFTNRYGAAGRYDGGKYETYLFGRTHVVGETATLEYDYGPWTFAAEEGFGGKIEPTPFYGPPGESMAPQNHLPTIPIWDPYPGPVAQESTFVAHAHLGAVYKKQFLLGFHYLDVFANDNERAGSYEADMSGYGTGSRPTTDPKPGLKIYGVDLKVLSGLLGDGYIGWAHMKASNILYLQDAVEVLHSFGGVQLHDNFFGQPGRTEITGGTVDTFLFQEVFSFGSLFRYPQAFWGDGPDLIASVFGMYNIVHSDSTGYTDIKKLKWGADLTYLPLPWFGIGARFDLVSPDMSDKEQNFSVFSPRIVIKTAFVTHEQVILQYSHYSYGSSAAQSQYPYTAQPGGASLGADKNAATIAATIWF
jgi:hypothetical protein